MHLNSNWNFQRQMQCDVSFSQSLKDNSTKKYVPLSMSVWIWFCYRCLCGGYHQSCSRMSLYRCQDWAMPLCSLQRLPSSEWTRETTGRYGSSDRAPFWPSWDWNRSVLRWAPRSSCNKTNLHIVYVIIVIVVMRAYVSCDNINITRPCTSTSSNHWTTLSIREIWQDCCYFLKQ